MKAFALIPAHMDSGVRRNVVLLWGGQATSQMATEVAATTVPFVALMTLDATTGQVGLLRASVTAPTLALSLLIGAWVDRTRRQPLLAGSCVLQCTALAMLALLAFTGALSLVTMLAAGLMVGVGAVIFDVAYPALVPTIVPARRLPSINGRLFAAQSTAEAIGPGVAGALVAGVGAAWSLVVNAAAFLIAGRALASMTCHETKPERTGRPVPEDIWLGLWAVLHHRLLRPLILGGALYNFWYDALMTVFLTHTVSHLGLSAAVVGAILASASIGAIAGSAVSESLVRRLGLGRMLIVTYSGAVLLPILMLLARDVTLRTIVLLAVSFMSSTLCTSAYNVQSVSLRQLITPTWALGRVSASAWFLVVGSLPLGALVGGALGDALGTTAALTATLVALPTGLIMLFASNVRTLTMRPGIDEDFWRRYAA